MAGIFGFIVLVVIVMLVQDHVPAGHDRHAAAQPG
jgi:hypothetical protein